MSYELYEMVMVGCEEVYDRPFEVDDDEFIDFEEGSEDFFFDGMFGD